MNKKQKYLYPFLIIIAGLVVAVIMIKMRDKVERKPVSIPPPLVRARTIEIQDHQLIVRSQGTVIPRTESELVAQVAGQVIEVAPQFASGGFFNKKDMLVRLDPRDYEFALARLEAEITQAELQLAQEEEEAEIAHQEWEELGEGEQPHPLVLRKPQLARARATLTAAKASYQQAQLNLARTEIRAPFDGRVRSKKVDLGEYVNPGLSLATIYAVDYAEVRLPVPDEDMAYLDRFLEDRNQEMSSFNIPVILKASYAGKVHQWKGKIIRMEGEIDPLTRMVHLVARVDDPYGRDKKSSQPPLAVGLFVEAEIMGRQVDGVTVIDRSALRGENRVLVIDEEDRLHFRNVNILRSDAETVIIDSGLKNGERICVSPLETVVDGMKVRIAEEKGA
jgi:RND family efflux transporter MFP subunit